MDLPHDVLKQYTDESASTIHHALRASRRRLVIALLAYRTLTFSGEADEPTGRSQSEPHFVETEFPVRQLSREITAIEQATSVEQATGDDYRSVYTSLIQTHLPRLDAVGAITYDGDRKMVQPDQNLLPLATAVAVTTPVAQLFFHRAIADLYAESVRGRPDSIGN